VANHGKLAAAQRWLDVLIVTVIGVVAVAIGLEWRHGDRPHGR
jgi:hypothetical protein